VIPPGIAKRNEEIAFREFVSPFGSFAFCCHISGIDLFMATLPIAELTFLG
jgi:hypothetical protein